LYSTGGKAIFIWILQTGEPLHIDAGNPRPMRAMNLSNALVQAGHNVVLWSSAFYHQEKRHRSIKEERIRVSDKLEIHLIPSRGYRRNIGVERLLDHAQLAFNLKKMLYRESHLPDVAFIGYPPIETAAVLVRWLARSGVPTLIDVKDQWPEIFLNVVPEYFKPLARLLFSPLFYFARRAIRESTGISVMADGFLDWTLEFIQRERTEMDGVFPLTSPCDQVSSQQLEDARKWWDAQGIIHNGRQRLCFVGSHSPAFDFRPVQEAARIAANSEMSPCEFVICGDGSTSSDLRAMMSNLPNVLFPGWIDRPKIEALAERCQGALAPYLNNDSFQRSIPNKVIDALSLGLPILTPLQGEVASLIDEYGIGIRYGTDTGRSLYESIQLLTKDPVLQKSMSQKACALYREKFSFETVYGRLVKHLEKMAHLDMRKQITVTT